MKLKCTDKIRLCYDLMLGDKGWRPATNKDKGHPDYLPECVLKLHSIGFDENNCAWYEFSIDSDPKDKNYPDFNIHELVKLFENGTFVKEVE